MVIYHMVELVKYTKATKTFLLLLFYSIVKKLMIIYLKNPPSIRYQEGLDIVLILPGE